MKSRIPRPGRILLGAATALALAFGGAQAFAATASSVGAARACDLWTCDESCISRGYSAGMCTYKNECRCYP